MCYQLFDGTGFAVDEDSTICRRGDIDLLSEGSHRRALADDIEVGGDRGEYLLVLHLQWPLVQSIAHGQDSLFEVEWFLYKIYGAELGSLHGSLYIAVT